MKIRIGSRGSNLALWQARWVCERLRGLGAEPDIVVIRTTGDARLDRFAAIATKGIFIKEIEEALLRREIDLAVHSLKDLPTILPQGLMLAAIPERQDPADVLIASGAAAGISDLAPAARVGTSSPRRICQLRARRPDLQAVEIRGNVETRVRKVDNGEVDAVVLAFAGIHRLGLDHRITARLELAEMLPAPGQGALAVETHAESGELNALLQQLDHPPTRSATGAERLLLERLGGGCRLPLGALARWKDGRLVLEAVIGKPDGSEILRGASSGTGAEDAAEQMAQFFKSRGAMEWLESECT
ncbi:MAG: hydroxymethylbilane synthase [Acidobacteria bacterium]|nr:hydroxymethylbilane synthase [Acidobacteriota bacterium]